MTREEKIEIMFESILSEFEEIKGLNRGGTHGKVQYSNEGLFKKIGDLKLEISQIQIPNYHESINRLETKLDSLYLHHKLHKNEGRESQLYKRKWGFIKSLLILSLILNIYLLWKLFA